MPVHCIVCEMLWITNITSIARRTYPYVHTHKRNHMAHVHNTQHSAYTWNTLTIRINWQTLSVQNNETTLTAHIRCTVTEYSANTLFVNSYEHYSSNIAKGETHWAKHFHCWKKWKKNNFVSPVAHRFGYMIFFSNTTVSTDYHLFYSLTTRNALQCIYIAHYSIYAFATHDPGSGSQAHSGTFLSR